jgi:hypothetical protein
LQPPKTIISNKTPTPAILLKLAHLDGLDGVARLLDGLVSFNLFAMFDESSSFESEKCTAKRVSLSSDHMPKPKTWQESRLSSPPLGALAPQDHASRGCFGDKPSIFVGDFALDVTDSASPAHHSAFGS